MAAPAKQFRWSWRSAAFRGLVYQVIAVAARRRGGLVSRPQHAPQHARARDPERVRLPDSSRRASRSARASGSSTLRTPTSRPTSIGLSNTLRVAIVGIVLGDDHRARSIGIGRLSQNFLLRSLCTRVRRDVPQRAAAAAALHLVFRLHRVPAADRRSAAAAAGRFLQQERSPVSDSGLGARATCRGRSASSSGMRRRRGLGEVRAAPVRGDRQRALPGRPARAGDSSSAWQLHRLARGRRADARSTSRRRPRSPLSAAAPSRRSSSPC